MAFCKNCGAHLNEGENFCHRCGAPQENTSNNQSGYNYGYQNQQNNCAGSPTGNQQNSYNYGSPDSNGQYNYSAPNQQNQYNSYYSNDSGNLLWAVLGFFLPIVGIVLFFVWRTQKPKTAKRLLVGAIIKIVLNILSYIFLTIVGLSAPFFYLPSGSFEEIQNLAISLFM